MKADPKHPVIALDAMGGDVGPEVVVAGAELARERYPNLRQLQERCAQRPSFEASKPQ